MTNTIAAGAVCLGVLAMLMVAIQPNVGAQAQRPEIVGRWDITVAGPAGSHPSWLEVQWSGNRTLVGYFVGELGSARPVSRVEFANGEMRFSVPPQYDKGDSDLRFEGKLADGQLSGWMTDAAGVRMNWKASRAPSLRRTAAPEWGAPISLVDMAAWQQAVDSQWKVENGVLVNAKTGANLITRRTFEDFKLHLEFRLGKGGNSGVYLRGRYEVQVADMVGREVGVQHVGGIYGFLAPNQDAAGQPGEWQSMDITLVGRLVSIVLNGKAVITEREIPGITGGALDSAEGQPGPLMLQGDHTAVEYRNIVLTPSK